RIQVHLEGRCLLLHSNEGYMRELFINLIDNAIKYNNPGGTVSITIEHVGTQAKIVIADNGIGIPLQAQSRIFERFYRVDKSRSKQRGGTGLGLSIVKHIVDYHSGTISLRSELGHGTEITICCRKNEKQLQACFVSDGRNRLSGQTT
ncbi:MAG: sensor histidine kinase, partial [Ruminococcus sp.]